MRNRGRLSRYSWLYTTVSAFLAFLMVITLLPHELIAQELHDDPNLPEVITLSAFDITGNSAMLEGSLHSLGAGDSVQVLFEYGTDGKFKQMSQLTEMVDVGDFQIKITKLKPDTAYQFRAKAINSFGETLGEENNFTTLSAEENSDNPTPTPDETPATTPTESFASDLVPPEVVTVTPATDISTNSAFLQGSLTSLGSAEMVKAFFEYGELPSCELTTEMQEFKETGDFQAELQGLKPDTTYYYRSRVLSAAGQDFGDLDTFTTLPDDSNITDTPPPEESAIVASPPEAEKYPLKSILKKIMRLRQKITESSYPSPKERPLKSSM